MIRSNYVHLIARSCNGDLIGIIRDFKKYTSKKIIESIQQGNESRKDWMLRLFAHAAKKQNKNGEYQVWTHENHAVELISNGFIDQKVDYIHQNPVRADIVNGPEKYIYSSAADYNDEKGPLDVIKISLSWKTL